MTTTTIRTVAKSKATNPLEALLDYGQSPWMDYVRRDLLTSGQLKKYIDEDGLRGMTSNPTIFEKAITGSNLYADILNSPEAKKLTLFSRVRHSPDPTFGTRSSTASRAATHFTVRTRGDRFCESQSASTIATIRNA